MDNHERARIVARADRFAPGNPPEVREEEKDLCCPVCRVETKDGGKCQECINADNEMMEDR